MSKTQLYLLKRFIATNWRYHSLTQTKYDVGETFTSDIKELREKGMIKPTPGINGWLIELVGDW